MRSNRSTSSPVAVVLTSNRSQSAFHISRTASSCARAAQVRTRSVFFERPGFLFVIVALLVHSFGVKRSRWISFSPSREPRPSVAVVPRLAGQAFPVDFRGQSLLARNLDLFHRAAHHAGKKDADGAFLGPRSRFETVHCVFPPPIRNSRSPTPKAGR